METGKTLKATLPKILGDYAQSDSVKFHMPGHKGTGLGGFFGDQLAKWDVCSLDSILYECPTGILERAEKSYSDVYGAECTCFLCTGVSGAIRAMISAIRNVTDSILLQDCCTLWADTATSMFGMKKYYLNAGFVPDCGLPSFPTEELVDKALERTGAGAFLITSPDIYGFCADLEGISHAVHRHGALLLVDASYASHFAFSEYFPASPGLFADIWCHAPYYSMDALVQSSVVHLNACQISEKQLRDAVNIDSPEIPSQILLASLDWALFLAKIVNWTPYVRKIRTFEDAVDQKTAARVLNASYLPGSYEKDLSRVVLDIRGFGLTGYEVRNELKRHSIFIEFADTDRLVLLTSPEDSMVWYPALVRALEIMEQGSEYSSFSLYVPQTCELVEEQGDTSKKTAEYMDPKRSFGKVLMRPIGLKTSGTVLMHAGTIVNSTQIGWLERCHQEDVPLYGITEKGWIAVGI